MKTKVAAVVLGAGLSSRFCDTIPKVYHKLASSNFYVIDASISVLLKSSDVELIVVVINDRDMNFYRDTLFYNQSQKIQCTYGGDTRSQSVYKALSFIKKNFQEINYVMLHDAARPYLSLDLVQSHIIKVKSGAIAIDSALPVVDAIKRYHFSKPIQAHDHDKSEQNIVRYAEIVAREDLFRSQTPQTFHLKTLIQLCEDSGNLSTCDEISLFIKSGILPEVVITPYDNVKITYKEDLLSIERAYYTIS